MPLRPETAPTGGFLPNADLSQPIPEDTGLSTAAKVTGVGALGAGMLFAPALTLGAMATVGGGALLADSEGAKAAFRQENTIGSWMASGSRAFDGPAEEGYDPWADIAGTPYEEHWENFAPARSKAHADTIKADIDREVKDKKYLESQGAVGFAQGMAAGIFDPTILLPGGAVVRNARGGVSALRSTASVMGYGAAGATLTEGVLQATQQTRTGEESAMAIAGATVLSGLLGAGLARRAAASQVDAWGKAIEDDLGRGPDDPSAPAMADPVRTDPLAPAGEARDLDLDADITAAKDTTDALTAELEAVASRILPDSVKLQVVENLRADGDRVKTGAERLSFRDWEPGEPLPERVRMAVTETPGFKVWNQGNKLAAEDGKPLVLYHGSMRDMDQFKGGHATGTKVPSIFFTDEPTIADVYNNSAERITDSDMGATYPVFVRMTNPKVIDLKTAPVILNAANEVFAREVGENFAAVKQQVAAKYQGDPEIQALLKDKDAAAWRAFHEDQGYFGAVEGEYAAFNKMSDADRAALSQGAESRQRMSDIIDQAKAEGHDGVVIRGVRDAPRFRVQNQYVAFEPTQIKSVFNRGTFDPSDPNMSFSIRKETPEQQKLLQKGAWASDIANLKDAIAEDFPSVRRRAEGNEQGLAALDEMEAATKDLVKAIEGDTLADPAPLLVRMQEASARLEASDVKGSKLATQWVDRVVKKHGGEKPAIRSGESGPVAEGSFNRSNLMVTISRAALDPVGTLHHEAVHALKEVGTFSQREWRSLENAARNKGWLTVPEMADYAKLYDAAAGDPRLTEEAIAMAYQRWARGEEKLSGVNASTFARIKKFLAGVRDALIARFGDESPEKIFAKIDSGEIAARADGRRRERMTAARSQGAASVGAAAVKGSDYKLKGALGLERALQAMAPGLKLQNSPSSTVRGLASELFESSLKMTDAADWQAVAQRGIEAGEPGAVETRIKLWQANLARARQGLDNSFILYRKGSDKRRTGDLAVTSLSDFFAGPGDKLDFPQFREQVAMAMRNGDAHQVPEIAKAAKLIRAEVYQPLLDRAVKLGALPEGITPETAISYLNRQYNRQRIIAERDEFRGVIREWLSETEAKNAAVSGRLKNYLGEIESIEAANAAIEQGIAKRAEGVKRQTEKSTKKAKSERDGARKTLKREEAAARKAAQAEGRQPADFTARYDQIDAAFVKRGEEIEAETEVAKQEAAAKDEADKEKIAQAQTRLTEVNALIEETVVSYQGKSADAAKRAIEARRLADEERGDAKPRSKKPLKPVMEDAERIAARAPREANELDDLAEEIIDRILSTPEGRLPYDRQMNTEERGGFSVDARGPLAARDFMIEDNRIAQWLENDVNHLMASYVHTLSADLELTARFGSPDMVLARKEVLTSYAEMMRDQPRAVKEQLQARKDDDLRNIAAIRDRLRGTYKIPDNPDSITVRAARTVMTLNYLRLLGGMTLSAIPDVSRFVTTHGMGVFTDGLVPMMRNISTFAKHGQEAKWLAGSLEWINDTRMLALADISNTWGRHSKFERAISSMGTNFGVVSLMAPWNSVMKQVAGSMAQNRILRLAQRMASGALPARKDVEYLASLGISEGLLRRIGEQSKKHGFERNGLRFAETHLWDEGARPAIDALRVALRKSVDDLIITPGASELPKRASTLTGKIILQFKSFAFSSTQKMALAGLQQRDVQTLNGAVLAMALGSLVYYLKTVTSGREAKVPTSLDDPNLGPFLGEAFDRSGLAGILGELNGLVEKTTDGKVGLSAVTGKPVSRYASRNVTSSLLGPSFGLAEESFRAVNAAVGEGDWSQKDSHRARQLVPYNNLIWLRKAFDGAEAGINSALGVPERAR